MLTVTGLPVIIGVTVLALAVPLLAAWRWRRTTLTRPLGLTPVVALVLVSQALAISGVFLWVNRSYDFYTTWGDLAGQSGGTDTTIVQQATATDGGRTTVLHVPNPSGGTTDALAWLPPQYDQPAYRHHRFPVVVFLPGQPSTPNALYDNFEVGDIAANEVSSGAVAPFVMVMPPLMTDPPRDTECTDVPGGPQAETFLSRNLPRAITSSLRVQRPGRGWSLMGWSTGGFCAAKVGLSNPRDYASIVSFGGYYTPLTDDTTGDLFHGDAQLRKENSPRWLYERYGNHGQRLLMVSGKQDDESWASTAQMIRATEGNPDVGYIAFPVGGHNFENYRSYLGRALEWADVPGAKAT